jgi:L-ribulokinase
LLAAGAYKTIEEAQAAVCLPLRTVEPDPRAAAVYEQLYRHYRDLYFALGKRDAEPVALGRVLPELRKIAAQTRKAD